MVQGLEFSEYGLEARVLQLDIIANNLANMSTTGYKRDVVFNETLSLVNMNQQDQVPIQRITDFSQGIIRETGNSLDFAIKGNAFFSIQGAEGVLYTRNGKFQIDNEGYLCIEGGNKVLGERGPILITSDISVGEDGAIIENGAMIDRFDLVEFDDLSLLRKKGNGCFYIEEVDTGAQQAQEFTVFQGYVEDSNVNAINEMVSMIDLYRRFEADQKALRVQDESVSKAVNDVGRVS